MRVKALMVQNPITITIDASIKDAIELMKSRAIRHLPVISKDNALEGFVTLADLREGLLPSMLSDISLTDLMVRDPVTVSPSDPIEAAARRIYNHRISGMPVVSSGKVVGIITETDILRTFIDMMGLLTATSTLETLIDDGPECLRNVIRIIHKNGGDVINFNMTPYPEGRRICYFRLTRCETSGIIAALEAEGISVLDAAD